MSKQELWMPTIDDNYGANDMHTPTLIPVFDQAFKSNAAATISTLAVGGLQCAPPIASPIPADFPPSSISPPMPPSPISFLTPPPLSIQLSDVGWDLEDMDFQEWKSLTASRRIAVIRRWIVHATHKYGPLEHWAWDFSDQWHSIRSGDMPTLRHWLDGAKKRIKLGRSALSYLDQAMEGDMPASVEEWRDLYAQSHQLAFQLWTAVLCTQSMLDYTVSERTFT